MKEEAAGEVSPSSNHLLPYEIQLRHKLNETPNVLLHRLNHIIEDTQLEYLYFMLLYYSHGCNISM